MGSRGSDAWSNPGTQRADIDDERLRIAGELFRLFLTAKAVVDMEVST
jgi:hypothetical protein